MADGESTSVEDRVRTAQVEARARHISHNVRCLECGHQSIEESAADIAVRLRKVIRDDIRAGRSDKEIYEKLTTEYGESILYSPAFDAQTAILWLGGGDWSDSWNDVLSGKGEAARCGKDGRRFVRRDSALPKRTPNAQITRIAPFSEESLDMAPSLEALVDGLWYWCAGDAHIRLLYPSRAFVHNLS